MGLRQALALGAGTAALAAACVGGGAAAQGMDCADLKTLALDGVRIDVAEAITPDPLWPFPAASPFDGPNPGVTVPFCRVAGVADPEIGFEVWLPEPDAWNGRLQNFGNGGYAGVIGYSFLNQGLGRGYAVGATDAGHAETGGFDASWAVGHPERVESFGHGALHALTVVSKALVEARYGRPQDYAYYNGCSTGGRQGLAEAQLYPDDYDGISAGAPANNLVRLETSALWFPTAAPTGAPLPPPLIALVANAAIAHCDARDGVTDGVIRDPETCDFDPAQLVCEAGAAAGQCLTPEQVETARLMHAPRRVTAAGTTAYPGRPYGAGGFGDAGPPVPPAATLVAVRDSEHEWSLETFDFDRDVPPLEAEMHDLIATDPDLSAFAASGGKIILWHGWTDPLISAYNTVDYYRSVQAEMGEEAVAGFTRLFMAPGMDHCAGGAGPSLDTFDVVSALEAWVERGEAPTRIVATKRGPDGTPTMTRPLCPYPQVAVYDEGGSTDEAASFSCQEL